MDRGVHLEVDRGGPPGGGQGGCPPGGGQGGCPPGGGQGGVHLEVDRGVHLEVDRGGCPPGGQNFLYGKKSAKKISSKSIFFSPS